MLSYPWRQRLNVILRIIGIGSAQKNLGRFVKDEFTGDTLLKELEPLLDVGHR